MLQRETVRLRSKDISLLHSFVVNNRCRVIYIKLCLYCTSYNCTAAVSYRQLRGQEQDEEIALTNYKENEGSCSERSEPFEEEMDEEAVSLVPR